MDNYDDLLYDLYMFCTGLAIDVKRSKEFVERNPSEANKEYLAIDEMRLKIANEALYLLREIPKHP